MARSIEEIRTAMVTQKEAESSLAGLTTDSKVGIWGLFLYVVAVAHHLLESLWDVFRVDVEALVDKAGAGTLPWIVERAKEFQYDGATNYLLEVQPDGSVAYATVNEAARIIAFASAAERSNGVVTIKVAKDDGSGQPEKLLGPELTAFEGYWSKLKIPGVPSSVTSNDPNLLVVSGEVYYAPELDPVLVQADVEEAILVFLQQLPFNSLLYRERLQDAVQAVEGVVSTALNSLTIDGAEATRRQELLAGYAIINPAQPLANTLSYLPENA